MAYQFPSSPTIGDLANGFVWDGEKWLVAGSATGGFLPLAGGTLTGPLTLHGNAASALQAVPKQQLDASVSAVSVAAAPLDALAYNGMQINGGMNVSQERGATAVSISNDFKYVVDGWYVSSLGTQVVNGLMPAGAPLGFTNSVQQIVTTANAAPAAGHLCVTTQRIEGYRVARLAWGTTDARPITISFWVLSGKAGLYSGSVMNSAANRSCTFSYTINVAAAWEYKTITILGDTTGTWAKDNTVGMVVNFASLVGTTYATAAGSWVAGGFYGVPGSINNVAAVNDTLLITGVVVLPGTHALTAAQSPLLMRPYDQELVTCQRYFQHITGGTFVQGHCGNSTNCYGLLVHPGGEMRAVPTLSAPGSFYCWNAGTANVAATGVGLYYGGINRSLISWATTGMVAGNITTLISNSGGRLLLDARL